MNSFRALRIHKGADGGVDPRLETITRDELSPGEVLIRTQWSGINYKDALAVTGAGKILRRFPLVAGIDIAGTVLESADPRFTAGMPVAVTGCGVGEAHDGGFAEVARVPAEWVCPLPPGLDTRAAMALGTAGFTAALAIQRMEQNGQLPDMGPIAVTGATGGVGSWAIALLAARGYRVTALSRKTSSDDYLRALGASDILHLNEAELGTRPLEKTIWGGAVDNVGGTTLAWLTRTVVPLGNIASIGLAQSAELHTTVIPFILRGVSLLGINSVDMSRDQRLAVWQRLAEDLQRNSRVLPMIVRREVTLDGLVAVMPDYVAGTVVGRCLVRLSAA
jgi:acrylyl-CoA reductase (NADPH)